MPTVHVDARQFSGVAPGVTFAPHAGVNLWPYRPYHVESGADDYAVSANVLKVALVNGIADIVVPQTPAGEGVWVQFRSVKGLSGNGERWLVSIPGADCNLFDLPHLDPTDLSPETPPSPVWVAQLAAEVQDREDGDATNATNLTNHLNDAADAHDASAISFVPTGSVSSTDVQAAIAEIASDDTGFVPVTRTVNGHALSANVTVTASDVGLGNASNTSDANKPVSTAQAAADAAVATAAATDATNKVATETTRATTAEALLAPKASPALTGNPTAPTPAAGDNDTSIATTAFVVAAVKPLVGFNVKDYGAIGNGSTDDTTAIQACVNAATGTIAAGIAGARIIFPSGEYVISDTLALTRFAGSIEGLGLGNSSAYASSPGNGSVIRWNGPNTKSMVKLRDYADVLIADLRFEGKDAAKPTAIIESNWITGDGAGAAEFLRIERCHLGKWSWSTQGTNVGGASVGVLFSGDNGNNDQFVIRDSRIMGCDIGVSQPNSQSIWGILDNTIIESATTAGLKTSAAITLLNAQFNACAIDVQVDSTGNVLAFGWWSEQSGQLLSVTGLGRITVNGGKWLLGAPMTGSSNNFADVQFATGQSGLVMRNVEITNTLGTHPKLKLRATGGGGAIGGFLVMHDCQTTMAIGDFDVASVSTNALDIDIRSSNLKIRKKFTSATTLTTVGEEYVSPALIDPTLSGTITGITKSTVGLSNVDNTSDANKPVSTAQATADTAIGTAAATDATTKANAAQAAAIAASAQRASNLSDLANAATARTNLGLGNVDNTADTAKPVSTAQATADTAIGTAAALLMPPRQRVYVSGTYYATENHGVPGVVSNGDGLFTVVPFLVHTSLTISAIGAEVTTAAGAGNLRLGIYGSNASDQPTGAALLDATVTSGATTTGAKEAPVSLTLSPGLYWVGVGPQGGAPTIRTVGANAIAPVAATSLTGSTGGAGMNCYYMTGVSGALPTWSGLNVGSSGYRVAVKAA